MLATFGIFSALCSQAVATRVGMWPLREEDVSWEDKSPGRCQEKSQACAWGLLEGREADLSVRQELVRQL